MESSPQKKGRNWYSAMGVLFLVSGVIVLVRDSILWSPEFVVDFLFDGEINSAKVSIGMLVFGGFLLAFGMRKRNVQ